MNEHQRHEARIGAWLREQAPPRPPDGLRDEILLITASLNPRPAWLAKVARATAVWPTKPWMAAQSMRVALALLALLLALAALALVAGSRKPEPDHAIVVPACWGDTRSPQPVTGVMPLPGTRLSIEYTVPRGLDMAAETSSGVIGFAVGAPGLSYGLPETEAPTPIAHARGVVIADISFATLHTGLGNKPRLGTDPASFLDALDATAEFDVHDLSPTYLGEVPALGAKVSVEAPTGWTHIDRTDRVTGDRTCVTEFALPNEVVVADPGQGMILVQIWALTNDDLEAWRPTALALVNSIRFVEGP